MSDLEFGCWYGIELGRGGGVSVGFLSIGVGMVYRFIFVNVDRVRVLFWVVGI